MNMNTSIPFSDLRGSLAASIDFLAGNWEWAWLGQVIILAVLLLTVMAWRRVPAGARHPRVLALTQPQPHFASTQQTSRVGPIPGAASAPPRSPGAPAPTVALSVAATGVTTWPASSVSESSEGGDGSEPSMTHGQATASVSRPDRGRPGGLRRFLPEPKPQPDPLWGPTLALDSDVALGKELGSGGQGSVHAVQGDPSKVYKTLASPVEGALEEYLRFAALGGSMRSALADADVELVWPEAPRVVSGAITGYVMPRIPAGYTVTVRGVQKEAQLQYALPKEGPFRPDVVPDLEQRIALVRAVGQFLDALHAHDYVYGDISWFNIQYRLDPRPTVLVFDLDGARRLGGRPVLAAKALDTLDWADHVGSSDIGAGFDSDRYKYALLIHRMLVSTHVSAPLPADPTVPADTGLAPELAVRLGRLLRRAAAGPGGRPAMSEWLAALTALPVGAAR